MAWNLCFLSVIVISTSVHVGIHAATDCYWRSRLYSGYRQTTENGTLCQRWDAYKRDYIVPKNFPDATVSDAANFCRDPDRTGYPWCFFRGDSWISCGIAKCVNYKVMQCGTLKIEQPTILGRNVTFYFTPDTNDPHEFHGWQWTNKENPWATLPVGNKFVQYKQNGSYYLTVTNTVNDHTGTDAVFYRILYYNQTVMCRMDPVKLNLLDLSRHPCGYVYLRTDKVREDENVEIEYYPSRNVMSNPQNFERQWTRSNTKFIPIKLKRYLYEEEQGLNDKYVLTIFSFNHRMDDLYGVNCGVGPGYTNFVSVIIPVPPSAPVLNGSQAIEECKNCIVGQDGDKFRVLCKTTGGTEPVDVTIMVGNEPQTIVPYPVEDGYIAFFFLQDRYHMAAVTCTVSNVALTTPLNVSNHIYVIRSPVFQSFNVPDVLREGDTVNISCAFYGGRPALKIILNISDVDVTSLDHMEYYVDEKSFVNITAVSLTTFEREWNGKNITCCRYNEWYNIKDECTPPKQLNYLCVEARTARRFQRRNYFAAGPNFIWHLDGYDKLKPYGLCIHGCICGFSRKVIWLNVYHTNNNPKIVAGYFVEALDEYGGTPRMIRGDFGTENVVVRDLQRDLRADENAYISGSSTLNQQIESWWGYLRRQHIQYWMDTFKTLQNAGDFSGSDSDKCLVQFCFMALLQTELSLAATMWNSHSIRRSRNNVPYGQPNRMHTFPGLWNTTDYLRPVSRDDIDACRGRVEFRSTVCCAPDMYNVCIDIMAEDSLLPGNTVDEAVGLYQHLRRQIHVIHI